LHFSAIRELTRVATPETQSEWRKDARGKNLRQIEQAVSGRKRGDRPTDPAQPDLRMHTLRFEVRPAIFALLRQAHQTLNTERGEYLDDDALIAALCAAVLERVEHEGGTRSRFQILTTVCESCRQARQQGGGVEVAIDAADRERAECDAQRIGSVDAPAERASQDVTPKTRELVERRDGGTCCVPGCRAARYTEIHHIVPRAAGGSHKAENLTLLCDGHHRALHLGKLTITGKAPSLDVRWTSSAGTHIGMNETRAHVGSEPPMEPGSRFALVKLTTEARQALVQLNFPKAVAGDAVAAALDQLGPTTTLEKLIFEALRRLSRS
jgi:hypothetical protein